MASMLNDSSDTAFPLSNPSSLPGVSVQTRPDLKHAPLSNTIAEKGHQLRSRPASPTNPTSPPSPTGAGSRDTSLHGIGRAFVLRCLRMARRGNLAFLIVFLRYAWPFLCYSLFVTRLKVVASISSGDAFYNLAASRCRVMQMLSHGRRSSCLFPTNIFEPSFSTSGHFL